MIGTFRRRLSLFGLGTISRLAIGKPFLGTATRCPALGVAVALDVGSELARPVR